MAKEELGWIKSPDIASAVSLAFVVLLVWLAIHRIHKKVFKTEQKQLFA